MSQVHPSLLERKIIHVDMDAFYASIEVLDRPELKGLPLVVGGSPQSRGVVCTASYEARKFGVRSAMPCSRAYRLCPQAIFVKPRFERYSEVSRQIRAIFGRYTPLVEPLSLDEAYLDVTRDPLGRYAVEIAKEIRAAIRAELGLTASAGVAPNKMLAKIASDLNKPDGLSVIRPDQVAAFMPKLAVGRVHGIGPVSARRLEEQGLSTLGDVLARPRAELDELLGERFAGWLVRRAQGLDDRQVETHRVRKSLGNETTFPRDLTGAEAIEAALTALAAEAAEDLAKRRLKGRTLTVKVRYPDFKTVTRAVTMPAATDDRDVIAAAARHLVAKTDAVLRGVRLLGVSLSRFDDGVSPAAPRPRSLFGD